MKKQSHNTGRFPCSHNGRMIHVINDIEDFVKGKTNGQPDVVVCTQRMNDFKHINRYLRQIHEALTPHGLFVGRVETLEERKRRLALDNKQFIFRCLVLYEFVFKRLLPRLPVVRVIYRQFRIRKHRLLSKCEALGRLRFCGFDIIACNSLDCDVCFIVRRNAQPKKGKPHDGIFIKIPKVGRNGKTIYCHKLRTMHPYADYLHDYILDNLKLDNNGKVIADFRKTGWGRFIRKAWLDEIPQLYNILKGDLSFIGLRPLSPQFLALYPEKWRTERHRLKPGFVPPYYADCPKTFDDIIASEKRYSRLKQRHPFTTDMIYFLRVVHSFLSGKARTG